MDGFRRTPVTMAAITAMTLFLSGCIAFDTAGGVADAGVSVVTTTGDTVASSFQGDDPDNGKIEVSP
jgi:hypothetical protein